MTFSPDLYGYCDRFEYRPGEQIAVHVHSAEPSVTVDVVRLRSADERVKTALPLEETVACIAQTTISGELQTTHPGSFALVEGLDELGIAQVVTVQLWMLPTLLSNAAGQGILAIGGREHGISLVLAPDDHLEVRLNGKPVCRGERPFERGTWCHVAFSVSPQDRRVNLTHETQRPLQGGRGSSTTNATFDDDTATVMTPAASCAGSRRRRARR